MDIFDQKSIHPMLIAEQQKPFDSPDYIYELKLDGERVLVYLDKDSTVLQNKRGIILNTRYPELCELHKAAKVKCILDGELIVMVDGKPKFSEIQRRSLLSNRMRIELASKQHPASFTAYDVLYCKNEPVMDRPLMERKRLLQTAFRENGTLALSRFIAGKGIALYDLAAKQGLEGVVAKRKDSLYYPGKRTKDWIKFKNLLDEDFVVCGYVEKSANVVSVILGQYNQVGKLIDKGHVTLGVSREDFARIASLPHSNAYFVSKSNENAVWVDIKLVCTVKYMEKTPSGGLRQPVFKGLRDDKVPEECIE
ncbi:DNA ligase [Ethanoligenens sp.]|uniref:ATP-dependent DNA ligase n=1 Tax=Ethanoligenens sp. TaxID=2099655 RepID=UPI0039EA6D7F